MTRHYDALKSIKDQGPTDDALDLFLDYLDGVFHESVGKRVDPFWFKPGPKFDPTLLAELLVEFEDVDPEITFWYSWMPYRQFLKQDDLWGQHVVKHNAKVEREFPPERWRGLKISLD